MNGRTIERLVAALRDPIAEFVREARVRIVLLVTQSGQILAQHGFAAQYGIHDVASLAAATHASAGALAELTGARRWTHMHHAGRRQELFLAPIRTPAGHLVLVAIFDRDSSLGMVRLFFDRLAERIAKLGELEVPAPSSDGSFEADLEAGLRHALSRLPSSEV